MQVTHSASRQRIEIDRLCAGGSVAGFGTIIDLTVGDGERRLKDVQLRRIRCRSLNAVVCFVHDREGIGLVLNMREKVMSARIVDRRWSAEDHGLTGRNALRDIEAANETADERLAKLEGKVVVLRSGILDADGVDREIGRVRSTALRAGNVEVFA